MLRHGSLFSGIGGFDYAASIMGWENVFHCELNPFCRQVLKYHFPNSISYEDITKTDFSIYRGRIDIISGGFPCQPYSLAGKRLGKNDERHLWPEMLRVIREVSPKWIVGENVFGIVNWSGGLVFEEVQTDLEREGYEVQSYILPAAGVDAPHKRDRVWFVAYRTSKRLERAPGQSIQGASNGLASCGRPTKNPNSDGRPGNEWQEKPCEWGQRNACAGDNEWISTDNSEVGIVADAYISTEGPSRKSKGIKEYRGKDDLQPGKWREKAELDNRLHEFSQYAPDTKYTRLQGCEEFGSVRECRKKPHEQPPGCFFSNWQNFPTQSPICFGNDGISSRLDSTAISFPKWRNESIKAAGNAVVPQVVLQIFKAIQEYENLY